MNGELGLVVLDTPDQYTNYTRSAADPPDAEEHAHATVL